MTAPAGWHRQPDGRDRYWDGTAWTDQYRTPTGTDLGAATPGWAPVQPPGRRGIKHWVGYPATALVALLVGVAAGGARDGNEATNASRPSTSTAASSEPATEAPTPTPTPEFSATAKDFKIVVKVLRKQCFGSAGCNVTYRISPEYIGLGDLPETGTVEVTYTVTGGEDPATNTFTIENGTASFDSEETLSTASSSKRLTAVATDVNYSP